MKILLAVIEKQIEHAINNQASWQGLNEGNYQYWLGQKHALKNIRSAIHDGSVCYGYDAKCECKECNDYRLKIVSERG